MPIENNGVYKAEPLKPKELRGRFLTRYELETVINFNKEEDMAVVFTYEKSWQKHIEKRMGIQPYLDNGFGGKSYKIPKNRIRKPLAFRTGAKRTLSPERKKQLAETLKRAREQR
jgi:hypothetical protein